MAIEAIVDQVVNFTDTSTGLNDTGVTYEWQFGDGQTATTKNAAHAYTKKGIYNIVHSVKNSCDATPTPCTGNTVTVITKLCGWIKGIGGATSVNVPALSTLFDAYYGFGSLGFTPTLTELSGTFDYYYGFTSSGNTQTGCSF